MSNNGKGMKITRAHTITGIDSHSFAYYSNPTELEHLGRGILFKPQHIKPDSVYVFSIGVHWAPGAWQKAIDMVDYSIEQGITCWFMELRDSRCQIPYTELPSMRNTALQIARDAGFEWVMLIENDALPEKDMILRLVRHNLPVIVPYIKNKQDPGTQKIADPVYQENTGIGIVKWAVFTCLLMQCRVLNCFQDCMPFTDVTHELDFYRKLHHYGHNVYQDTTTILEVASVPNRPGDLKSWEELQSFWRKADVRRRGVPDRRPIGRNDPNQQNGIYLPLRFQGAKVKEALPVAEE